MSQEAMDLVLKCESCQKYSPKIGHPLAKLISICIARALAKWGIDLGISIAPVQTVHIYHSGDLLLLQMDRSQDVDIHYEFASYKIPQV